MNHKQVIITALADMEKAHAEEFKALSLRLAAEVIAARESALAEARQTKASAARDAALAEVKSLQRQLGNVQRLANKLRTQRDTFKGKAAEYRSYASKYQRDLVAARDELKQLMKEANA